MRRSNVVGRKWKMQMAEGEKFCGGLNCRRGHQKRNKGGKYFKGRSRVKAGDKEIGDDKSLNDNSDDTEVGEGRGAGVQSDGLGAG